ncbi:MAG TPA: hypothetical protein VG448_11100, partial [Solirubrobacterales bacterium]|nr:hypothetical protein [Solirubrobacterales bacterium]
MSALRGPSLIATLLVAFVALIAGIVSLHRPLSSLPSPSWRGAAAPRTPGAKFAEPAPVGAATLERVGGVAPTTRGVGSRPGAVAGVLGALWPTLSIVLF